MWWKLSVLLLLCVACVLVQCDLDRRDTIHRIVLKPERSKKGPKRQTRLKGQKYQIDQEAHSSVEDPHYRYEKHRSKPHHLYHNHHEEYHELIQPKPPKLYSPYSYPEEEPATEYQQAASNHFNVNYQDKWLSSKSHTQPHSSRKVHPAPSKKPKSKATRSTRKPINISDMIDITTSRPTKTPLPIIAAHSHSHIINHREKIQPHKFKPLPSNTRSKYHVPLKTANSYEVYEDVQEPEPPRRSSFHNLSPVGAFSNMIENAPYMLTNGPQNGFGFNRRQGNYTVRRNVISHF